ncbi:MAG: extracellular solute-binding protein [Betaproteobacteria bacterium]|nr:extracellular solute-binding protein [Betaproteobacteria bacterium]
MLARATGALVLALACQPTIAGAQAEKALAAVQDLIVRGEIKRGAVIKVAFKPGNINALLGPDLELQKDWERLTGTVVNARIIPQQPALANLRDNPDIDITVARTHEFPDLIKERLVEELTPYGKEFAYQLGDGPPDGFVRLDLQAYFGDRLVAIPADGDVILYYLRKDLLEDPQERAAFRKRYGRDLAIPTTWKELQDLAAFFHRPEKGLYGIAEERDEAGGWMYWLPRYLDQEAPYRRLFDDAMRPLINSPAGIAATESYVAAVRYSPPDILGEGKDYGYTLPLFMQGKAFASGFTIAAAKLFNAPGSGVRDKFVAFPIPGMLVKGKLVRHTIPIYGNNLVISSRGAQRKLAYLFAMWLTDPDISLRTVGAKGGHTDPYRWHQLNDPRIRDLYSAQALEVFASEWTAALPPGTGLPGDGEYLAALDHNIWLAAAGRQSAGEAMKRTAAEWEKITERYGRANQIAYLKRFLGRFPAPTGQSGR